MNSNIFDDKNILIKIYESIKNYAYLVEFSAENDAYLAKCLELVIMAHGDSQEEAIQLLYTGEH